MQFTAHTLDDTAAIARRLAEMLVAPCCLTLEGDLGAGKTTFVRYLVAALGGEPRQVSSPTFVLMNRYDAPRATVYHLDAYRLAGADELEAIGFDEVLADPRGLTIVEWASRVSEALPARRFALAIESLGETTRRFTLAPPA